MKLSVGEIVTRTDPNTESLYLFDDVPTLLQ